MEMQERAEKLSTNGMKGAVKKEGGSALKSNGFAVKKEAESTSGQRKELLGRLSSNGVKPVVKTSGASTVKANGASTAKREIPEKSNGSALVKREVADVKREASTSGVKGIVKKSVTTVSASTVVSKKTKTEEKEKKKVFTLPGQKHEPPEERDSLRIFYETLHEQKPDSEMAEVWMMEHGLLLPEHAKKAFEKKQKRGSTSFGTPVKSSTPSRDHNSRVVSKNSMSNGKQTTSKAVEQKGKRKWEYDSDDELLIARPLKRKLKT